MHKDYGFEPKIPYCKQLDEDRNESDKDVMLSTKQTNDTRMVTKIRYQIERNNGYLKFNRSLDYIYNSQAGHIFIDWRIACAISNYTLKPSYSDYPKTIDVARKLKKNYQKKKNNNLEFLLKKRISIDKTFIRTELAGIDDFVKLKRKYLKRKIFCGGYQLKMSKSYLKDLIDHNVAYTLDKKLFKERLEKKPELKLQLSPKLLADILDPNSKTKIIALEIMSRHSRGKTKPPSNEEKSKFKNIYKVFIHYVPISHFEEYQITRKEKAIRGFICSCLSGRRTVTPCSHISTVLYYLSWYSDSENPKIVIYPAHYLNNIFLDKDNLEIPNDPKYNEIFIKIILLLLI